MKIFNKIAIATLSGALLFSPLVSAQESEASSEVKPELIAKGAIAAGVVAAGLIVISDDNDVANFGGVSLPPTPTDPDEPATGTTGTTSTTTTSATGTSGTDSTGNTSSTGTTGTY